MPKTVLSSTETGLKTVTAYACPRRLKCDREPPFYAILFVGSGSSEQSCARGSTSRGATPTIAAVRYVRPGRRRRCSRKINSPTQCASCLRLIGFTLRRPRSLFLTAQQDLA